MIITKISDGFGNQLFMYACGYAVAKRLNTKLSIDISYLDNNTLRKYELNNLNIKYKSIFTTQKLNYYPLKVAYRKLYHAWLHMKGFRIFKEKQTYIYNPDIEQLKDKTYLYGYWQTEKYFKDYRSDILKMFIPNYPLSTECKEYIKKVQQCNSVAVHVRRGDYVNLGICLDQSYYHQAILKMEERIETPQYFIFSDDIEYAKQLFKGKNGYFTYVQYQSENATIEDLFIMKSCKHIVMANSSYSWWAAWLNDNPDKIVIHPNDHQSDDFYPSNWSTI